MSKRHTEKVQHSSSKSDWRTPPELFAALNTEFHFDWDAAANTANHLVTKPGDDQCRWYGPGSESEDALAMNWVEDLRYVSAPRQPVLFMNPPYAKDEGLLIEPWLKKAWEQSSLGCTVVGVIPFNPQTEYFRTYVWGQEMEHAAVELRMISHRVSFVDPDNPARANAPGNTCVVVWKPNPGYVDVWQPVIRYWSYR